MVVINEITTNNNCGGCIMKRIAIVGAAGREGSCLVKEAIARGHEVTGFVRRKDQTIDPNAKRIVKDLFELTREDLIGFDVVIDAVGAWTPETLASLSSSAAYLCDCLSNTEVRLLVVGGAGSLYTDKGHTACVAEAPDFPEIYKPVAHAHDIILKGLRKREDVKWTYLSPAGDFRADGERTGKILIGGEEYFVNDKGESQISYRDYAIAMIDEAERAEHVGKRFSVIGA